MFVHARVRVRAGQNLTAITPPPLAYAYSRSSSLQIAHADDTPRVPSRHSAVGMQACARVCASDLAAQTLIATRTFAVICGHS